MNEISEMYQILAKFLKEAVDVFADPLSRILNLLVKLSLIPEDKIAKLKLLFNKGSKTNIFQTCPCVQNDWEVKTLPVTSLS